ncbi:hypothetical protein DMH26_00515 [Streptomyces sp. WAC 05379]|nr:hypothetical protein DMH26_00515 [Streptomyces sp. WAC 05379]
MPGRDAAQIERVGDLIDTTLLTGLAAPSGQGAPIPDSETLSRVLRHVQEDFPAFGAYRTKPIPVSKVSALDAALRHLGVLVHGDPDSFIDRPENDDENLGTGIAGSISRMERKRYSLSVMEDLARELVSLRKMLSVAPPASMIVSLLMSRLPSFVIFTAEDRELPSSIDLVSSEVIPRGLANLLRMAKIDGEELRKVVGADDHLQLAEMLEQANLILKDIFQAWRQESVWPVLHISNGTLRVLVRVANTSSYTDLHDRSDGLRQFIALVSCINAARYLEKGERDVIVLIDEAENHLHYDAQADLVEVFSRQDVAKQIIYSTHSAGCLPEDLGSGVRVVRQIHSTANSSIVNWFWSDGAGFTPLLLAMGAATLAFASVRRVLITEGPSDMLLLPSLLRQATGLKSLGYQVAPGLSELSPRLAEDLDLEAARSAFLVDGDPGGAALRQKLVESGNSADRVVVLGGDGSGVALEDLVGEPVYRSCVNELLDGGVPNHIPKNFALGERNRHPRVREWCEEKGISVPGKRLIAQCLARRARSEEIVSPAHVKTLQDLHSVVSGLLG